MTLIAILIALVLDRHVPVSLPGRRLEWYAASVAWARGRFGASKLWQGPVGVTVLIVVPVLLVGLIQYALDEALGILGFAFSTLVLLWCVGLQPVNAMIKGYLADWDGDDLGSARATVEDLLGHPAPTEPGALHRAVVEAILVKANERVLAVLLWFALLGPMGAVLMRLSSELYRVSLPAGEPADGGEFNESARLLRGILLWLPARLTALGYAVTGSFVEALHQWRAHLSEAADDWVGATDALLVRAGSGALQFELETLGDIDYETERQSAHDHVTSARALAWRTIILWLTVLGVLTVAGWAS